MHHLLNHLRKMIISYSTDVQRFHEPGLGGTMGNRNFLQFSFMTETRILSNQDNIRPFGNHFFECIILIYSIYYLAIATSSPFEWWSIPCSTVMTI